MKVIKRILFITIIIIIAYIFFEVSINLYVNHIPSNWKVKVSYSYSWKPNISGEYYIYDNKIIEKSNSGEVISSGAVGNKEKIVYFYDEKIDLDLLLSQDGQLDKNETLLNNVESEEDSGIKQTIENGKVFISLGEIVLNPTVTVTFKDGKAYENNNILNNIEKLIKESNKERRFGINYRSIIGIPFYYIDFNENNTFSQDESNEDYEDSTKVRENDDVYKMQVFVINDATDDEIKKFGEELKKIKGIINIELVTREDAYNTMKERLGENESALKDFDSSIFSASYTIEVDGEKDVEEMKKEIEKIKNFKNLTMNNLE